MRRYYLRTLMLLGLGVFLLFPSLASSNNNLFYEDQVAVIVYHHIHDKDKSSTTITRKLMKNQLDYLTRQGFQFITLAQFQHFFEGGDVPPNAVLVTFDDGYESYIENAYPILKERQIPAVNFIITETLDNPHGWKLPFLNRDEIRKMADNSDDMYQFQSHTRSLHSLTAKGEPYLLARLKIDGNPETETQYRQRIITDIKRSIQDLSELNRGPVQFLAYPYGAFNKDTIQMIREAGIRYAFTVVAEMTTRDTDPMQIPRINAGGPYMTPQNLHNAIMRRVVETGHVNKTLPLRETVAQLGGDVTSHENKLNIVLPKITCSVNSGSNQATVNGSILNLNQPIEKISKKNYIDLYDLEKIVGGRIVYLTNAQRYAVRVTPSVNP